MTHDDLVVRAAKWLTNIKRCSPVYTEQMTLSESPDAIGWTWQGSILVECKTSISDFLADKRKPCRVDGYLGVGRERFYMIAPGLLKTDKFLEIFDSTYEWHRGWGVVAVQTQVRVVIPANVQPKYSEFGEIRLLRAATLNGRPDHSLPDRPNVTLKKVK